MRCPTGLLTAMICIIQVYKYEVPHRAIAICDMHHTITATLWSNVSKIIKIWNASMSLVALKYMLPFLQHVAPLSYCINYDKVEFTWYLLFTYEVTGFFEQILSFIMRTMNTANEHKWLQSTGSTILHPTSALMIMVTLEKHKPNGN